MAPVSGAGGRPHSTTRVPASVSFRSLAATAAWCAASSIAPPVSTTAAARWRCSRVR